ncbi:olfactory receptor 5AS1-like [Gastrophryne carolinensis]
MWNETLFTELLLSGLSELPSLQLPLFLFFLLIYILTLTWNLLIIILIVTDSHLHTPMYFFLGNLASLDISCSTVIVPRMLMDLLTGRRVISLKACLTQIFFFASFNLSEFFLLSAMSYDRYVAICHPLHYMQMMHRNLCILFVLCVWSIGFLTGLIYTIFNLKLRFCKSNIVESFFCDMPPLFQISCSDIYVNIVAVFCLGVLLALPSMLMIFLPYAFIIKTILTMQIRGGGRKVFSTCSSHLMVATIFYVTIFFNYFHPLNSNHVIRDKVVSVFYTVVTPLFNPLIYSLRNQEFRTELRERFLKILPK